MQNSRLTLLTAVSLIVPAALHPQGSAAPGDRVRITAKDQRFDGRLLSISDDSVFVEMQRLRTIRYRDVIAPDTMALPLAALDRLEVSRGTGRRTASGALIGGGIAAVLGFMMGSGFDQCDDCSPSHSPGVNGLIGAGVFGVCGAAIGALVGSGIHWDRWEEVPSNRGGMLWRPLPSNGIGIGLTLRF